MIQYVYIWMTFMVITALWGKWCGLRSKWVSHPGAWPTGVFKKRSKCTLLTLAPSNFLTSCVGIVKIGVQAFFQKPGDLFDAPLLHILHELLQVGLMEGDKGVRRENGLWWGGWRGRRKRQLWLAHSRLVWLTPFNNAAARWKLNSLRNSLPAREGFMSLLSSYQTNGACGRR